MLYRYLRAFIIALKWTLQGKSAPQVSQHPLIVWIDRLAVVTDGVYQAAEKNGLGKKSREAIKLRLDGRMMSVETVLATVKFHAVQEYPTVLRSGLTRNVINNLYASNFDDLYRITQLAEIEALQTPPLLEAINLLKAHLSEFPPSENLLSFKNN